MDGTLGLAGWQWLFLVEGFPAVLLGFVVLFYLPNGPNEAKWLTADEKKWITSRLVTPVGGYHPQQRSTLRECFSSPVVWLLCLIYFLRNVASYGYEMWLPTMVKGLTGQGNIGVGFINAIPYLVAGVAMFLVGKHSDKTGERRMHMAGSAIAATIGFVIAAKTDNVFLAIAGLALAFAGSKSSMPTFWALSTNFLRGTAAAGGIALINAVGNLGGYFGPTWVGQIQDKTNSTDGGMILLGACYVGVAILAFVVPKVSEKPKTP
jgi:ACS family tartrate transporter-like MFS transporter